MIRYGVVSVLLFVCVTFMVVSTPASAQDKKQDYLSQRARTVYSLSYTPVYQFESNLDGKGTFNVNRHYFNFGVMQPFSRNFRMGLGFKYDFENYNFKDLYNVAGATPWGTIHRPGISIPTFYSFKSIYSLMVSPSLELSAESGAKVSDSIAYGATIALARPFGSDLYLGIGAAIFEQLEKPSIFPFILINWRINEQFRLSNPFQAGPAGPAGLELVFTPSTTWEFGISSAFRTYRFRLADKNAVSGGIGQDEFLASFLRVQRKLRKNLALDLSVGGLFLGELSIEDSGGSQIASEKYNPAPIVGLTIQCTF